MALVYTQTGQNNWDPKKPMSACERRRCHGPIQPMPSEPGFFARLFSSKNGRRAL